MERNVTDNNTLIKCGIHSNQALSNTEMEKLSVIYCVNKTLFSKTLSSIEHQLPANVANCTHNTQSRVRMGKGKGEGLIPEKNGRDCAAPLSKVLPKMTKIDTLFLTKISKNPYPLRVFIPI